MKSNLGIEEFKTRLKELTSDEKTFYLFTPYNSSGTPFCGRFDEKTFELTKNSYLTPIKTIVIKGEYTGLGDHSTEVTYEIGRTALMKKLFIAFNIIAFIGINAIILLNGDNVSYSLLSIILTLNGFLILGNLVTYFLNWIIIRIVNQRFRDEFQIGIEDEWEKLANSISARPPSS